MKRTIWPLALLVLAATSATRADENRQAADEAAIHKAVAAYVEAFNKGDADALAALWGPDAVYVNRDTGAQATGRSEIKKQFADQFADAKGSKLEVVSESIRFVSPNVAIEQGTAKLIQPGQSPDQSSYSAVYVRQDGQWLLDRVTEEEQPEPPPSNYEKLKPLEWLIGNWADEDGQNRVDLICQWTKNRNYIVRIFAVSIRDRVDMSGLQVIGWDPVAKQIRSWVFDSGGGFGEGVWTNKGNSWFIQTRGTLANGSKSSSVNILGKLDDDRFSWQTVNAEVDGELQPNGDEVVVVRQPAAE
jgi:uncharacterized protein (TIGR02246 family)